MNNVNELFTAVKAESDSPLIKWSATLIALSVLFVWVVEPIQIWRGELDQKVARSASKASRLKSMEESANLWLDASKQAALASADAERRLFAVASDTQAQAKMQTLVQQLATSRNLNVETQKALPLEFQENIGVRLSFDMTLRGELYDLLNFLDDVSRSEKLLLIDHWTVQLDRNGKAYGRFTISGFRPRPEDVPTDA